MKTSEIWRPIVGYEGLYEVSSYGRVKNVNRNTILKNSDVIGGYLHTALYKNGIRKYYKVHRLVAAAFIPNPDNLPVINHKDEDKKNNRVENLEWCTYKYNVNYGTRTKRAMETKIKNGYCDGRCKNEKEYMKKYRDEHKEHCIELKKKWYNEHREEYLKKFKQYYREVRKYKNDK